MKYFGSKGRLWRNNDQSEPPVKINTGGEWVELPLICNADDDPYGLVNAHKLFADTVLNGSEHPMSMEKAMRGFEVVMSIYESARLNARIELPLLQEEFPLDLMLKERSDF